MSKKNNSISHDIKPSDIVVRENFDIEIRKYYNSQSDKSKKQEWSQNRIDQVLNYIKGYQHNKSLKKRPSNQEYYHATKYEVLDTGEEKILTLKRKSDSCPIKQVIPSEKYYDVILETHLATNHGGRDKIIEAVKDKFLIPIFAVKIFINMCQICLQKKYNKMAATQALEVNDAKRTGKFEVIDLRSDPDGDYEWLLMYEDCKTEYCFLRPLKWVVPSQIAVELLKIFLEIGWPCHLLNINTEFTASVIKELMSLWPTCKILNGDPEKLGIECKEDSYQNIVNMMQAWMKDNMSTDWSVGCYFVQFELNSRLHHSIDITSHKVHKKKSNQATHLEPGLRHEKDNNYEGDGSTSWQCSDNGTSVPAELSVEEPELASQPEPEPEPYGCHACNITFSGFVYECVQCEYRMCADCDHAGVHNEHYVLRVPAHSPREEVKEVVSKVRVALNLVELRPPPHAHKKHGRKRRARRDSDDGPPEVPVIVKMEVDIEEDDPLTFPRSPSPSPCPSRVKREPDAAVPSDGNMYAMLDTTTEPQEDILQVIIKSEPPDEAPSTSQLPTTDLRHAQQLDLQRSQPHPQPQTTDTPGKRGADSAAEGKKPKKGRLKKKVDT